MFISKFELLPSFHPLICHLIIFIYQIFGAELGEGRKKEKKKRRNVERLLFNFDISQTNVSSSLRALFNHLLSK